MHTSSVVSDVNARVFRGVNAGIAGSGVAQNRREVPMVSPLLLEQDTTGSLQEVAQQLRVDSVRCSAAASSGHPTSSMSAADLMAVLLARYLRYDFAEPDAPGNDHLIFSKGHASPLYYSMLRAVGAIGEKE